MFRIKTKLLAISMLIIMFLLAPLLFTGCGEVDIFDILREKETETISTTDTTKPSTENSTNDDEKEKQELLLVEKKTSAKNNILNNYNDYKDEVHPDNKSQLDTLKGTYLAKINTMTEDFYLVTYLFQLQIQRFKLYDTYQADLTDLYRKYNNDINYYNQEQQKYLNLNMYIGLIYDYNTELSNLELQQQKLAIKQAKELQYLEYKWRASGLADGQIQAKLKETEQTHKYQYNALTNQIKALEESWDNRVKYESFNVLKDERYEKYLEDKDTLSEQYCADLSKKRIEINQLKLQIK